MADTKLFQLLQGIRDQNNAYILQRVLAPLFTAESSTVMTSAGLVITGAGGTTAKIGPAGFVCAVGGSLVKLAAGTVMPPLVGTVTNGKWNAYGFYINSLGNVTSLLGVEAATLAGVKLPSAQTGTAIIGFIIINPTGAGNFIGGTTPLDDAGVIPNAVYVSPVGSFNLNLGV